MLVYQADLKPPSLGFARDRRTGLPLVDSMPVLLKLALDFLALPHSVVEFGCGKKASLILWLLTLHGVPVHALKRGLVLEADMSPGALAEDDPGRRTDVMRVANPFHARADLGEESLRRMLADSGFRVDAAAAVIEAGPFRLHHVQTVQFAQARSHIFPIVTLWDPGAGRAVERVLDPTLCRRRLFPVAEIREFLSAPRSLIFTAPMCASFQLDPDRLTDAQRREIGDRLRPGLDTASHAALVRSLNGAERGSIGDPETWSYGNNFHPSGDAGHDEVQTRDTGLGDPLREDIAALLRARESGDDTGPARETVIRRIRDLELTRRMQRDARWSGRHLKPLARLAAVVSAHLSLREVAGAARAGIDWPCDPGSEDDLRRLRGIGVRLRQRIEDLALASSDEEGAIRALAFSPCFNRAASETIRQMNDAGLTVWIDRVGNLHGLGLEEHELESMSRGETDLRELSRDALCHGSHIDTVVDAGKHDGRLGVMAGIEVARVMHDLRRYFGVAPGVPATAGRLMVSAFVGEEMTFSGAGVSMPGSSAVTGRASVDEVHSMTNPNGDRLGDRLVEMLCFLDARRRAGEIDFQNPPTDDDPASLLAACPDPEHFFTRHSFERHIEQGPELDRAGVPLVLVGRVMGLHQEDFDFRGPRSEEAALELNLRLRELALEPRYDGVRVTVGILEGSEATTVAAPGWRWRLVGEKNPAGSTGMADRRDPGVAAARLARVFRENAASGRHLIGGVSLIPGGHRNMIPGEALLSLGLESPPDKRVRDGIFESLRTYLRETLAAEVADGGEHLECCEAGELEEIHVANRTRVSIDLRAASPETLASFRRETGERLEAIRREFGVAVSAEIHQQVAPMSPAAAGQVLQLERSYGGSHNPGEAQLADDLLRGTLVQLDATLAFRRHPEPATLNLHELTARRVPKPWRERLDPFVSGALHDTCNITAACESDR